MRKRKFHEHHEHDSIHRHQRGPDGHGHGRGGLRGEGRGAGRRAGRGAVGQSILALLAEQPRHGYELITALEERSGGRWRPSPGAVYPALRKLVERNLITAVTEGDTTRYELTDQGREAVAAAVEVGFTEPWTQAGAGRRGDLHRALGELVGPVRQIGRFGSPQQAAAAETVVRDATAQLYAILASPSATATGDETT